MTTDIQVTAPGKLFLFGEYAVLAGGWAMVAAVDRRVKIRRRTEAGEYRVMGADEADTRLVEAVLEAMGENWQAGAVLPGFEQLVKRGSQWQPGHFESDVGELYEGGEKLGLGSSAASAVALTAAAMVDQVEALDERKTREVLAFLADAAHRRFQGGTGSGGGILAATFGGISAFRRLEPVEPFLRLDGETAERVRRGTERREVALPSEVEIRTVWLGESTSTRSFIGAVERQLQLEPAPVYRALRRIADSAEQAMEACSEDDVEALLEAARRGDRAMEALGEAGGISVVTPAHETLRRVAGSHDVSAKPSGAGGGEFSLLFGSERTDWQAVEAELASEMRMIDVSFGAEGVTASEGASK